MRKSLIFLSLLLTACVPPEGGLTEDDVAGEWTLVDASLRGQEITIGNNPLTLRLDADGDLGGTAACNDYAGTYDVVASIFDLGAEMMMTTADCEEAAMRLEEEYFRAIRLVDSVAITEEGELHLVGEEADLLFEPANG